MKRTAQLLALAAAVRATPNVRAHRADAGAVTAKDLETINAGLKALRDELARKGEEFDREIKAKGVVGFFGVNNSWKIKRIDACLRVKA